MTDWEIKRGRVKPVVRIYPKNVRLCAYCGRRSDRGCIQKCRACSKLVRIKSITEQKHGW